MITVTLREAQAQLRRLVERALAGEEVMVQAGSKGAVTLVPVPGADPEATLRLSDAQVERFWRSVEAERSSARIRCFSDPAKAIAAFDPLLRMRSRKR